MERDHSFFLQLHEKKSFHQILVKINEKASEKNKKIIWDYIERLRLLCIKYFENDEEKRICLDKR